MRVSLCSMAVAVRNRVCIRDGMHRIEAVYTCHLTRHQHSFASPNASHGSHFLNRLALLVLHSLHVVAIGSLTKGKPLAAKTSATLPSKGAPIVGL